MEQILEQKAEFVEGFYNKIVKGIRKIPNRYLRDYVRGFVAPPFFLGPPVELISRHIKKMKRSRDEKDYYGLGSKMMMERTNEIKPNENMFVTISDFYTMVGGIVTNISLHLYVLHKVGHSNFLLLYTPLLIGSILDLTNCIQQRRKIKK